MKKYNYGFTLAEVLITLVIIGIIAAMTIPTLMNKTNEQELVVATKKAYSVLSQAWQKAVAENGSISIASLGETTDVSSKALGDMLVKHLNVQKNCGTSSDKDCFSTSNYAFLTDGKIGGESSFDMNTRGWYTFVLSDGMSVDIVVWTNETKKTVSDSVPLNTTFGYVTVDVNGDKGPNVLNIDLQQFWITEYGIFPQGVPSDVFYSLTTCLSNGFGCSAWVITKGNMDYLHKTVSW